MTTTRKRLLKPDFSPFTIGPHNIDAFIGGIVKNVQSPLLLIVDLFCGAGGTSTGFELTNGNALVIACVNHDYLAIKSHWRNYPHIAHFEEDIRTLELSSLVKLLAHYRCIYPSAKVVLWASLECTNFSRAKGGLPRDADSRTLADHLDRYIIALKPDYVKIENVVEFMSWGPLDSNGKPLSKKNGSDFMRWCNYIDSLGYRNEWREMNSADYGAYTSRNRLFGCFAKNGLPIVWPEATHSKTKKRRQTIQRTFFDEKELKPWKAVKEVLDFADEGNSIFERKVALSDRTLERIYAGLIKYVAGGKESFILKYNSTNQSGSHVPPSIDSPCPVIAAQNRLGITFVTKYYGGRPEGKNISIEGPAGTITTIDSQAVVNVNFIAQRNSGSPEGRIVDLNGPARTITCSGGNQDIVSAAFLQSYYGNGGVSAINSTCPTITTKDRLGVVKPVFIMRDFTNGDNNSSVDTAVGSILPVPKTNLVTCNRFIVNTHYSNGPSSIDAPLNTITANKKFQYLVLNEFGDIAVSICDDDTKCMRKIKEFMVLYRIIDIKMRMLKVNELLSIQGFPVGYKLEGSQQNQKKFIGNSVVPIVVKSWAYALVEQLSKTIYHVDCNR